MKQRYARHIGIVQQPRSKNWVSATALATRFDVDVRTIYHDIEELNTAGLPVESVAGREGGYRLSVESPVDLLITDADDVLSLNVLGLIDNEAITDPGLLQAGGVSAYARDALRKIGQRIYFDTRDWELARRRLRPRPCHPLHTAHQHRHRDHRPGQTPRPPRR
ncbi:helix-turn-helix transcriptional regulator [Micromonospora haikouensis]|uniref:helix-turn-helix transcriptional regulator n=1 Tax=Micromonospora haikouensis TaxID=686309 RepID=UPI0037A7C376